MTTYWNEVLETGSENLDKSYRQLFEVCRLYEEYAAGDRFDEGVNKLFSFLEKYAREHFPAEEALLKENHYPDLVIHSAQHKYFVSKFQRMRISGRPENFEYTVHKDIVDWMMIHISKDDKLWIDYLRHKREAEPVKVKPPEQPVARICPANKAMPSPEDDLPGLRRNFVLFAQEIKCPKCGAAVESSTSFCGSCGAKVKK